MRYFFSWLSVVLCIGLTLPLYGSATKKIFLSTTPDNATVFINEKAVGVTPLTVEIDTKKIQTIHFYKEGYTLFEQIIKPTSSNKSSLWYLLLPGGSLLYAFDAAKSKQPYSEEVAEITAILDPVPIFLDTSFASE